MKKTYEDKHVHLFKKGIGKMDMAKVHPFFSLHDPFFSLHRFQPSLIHILIHYHGQKIIWPTAKNGVVPDTTSNAQPI